MAQSDIQISTTPPLPGSKLVQETNSALETIATDFSGNVDPAAYASAYTTWADTGSGDLKRRNAANSSWDVVGRIFPKTTENSSGDVTVQGSLTVKDRLIAPVLGLGSFIKADPDAPAFAKTSKYQPVIKAGLQVSFSDGTSYVWEKQTDIDVTHNEIGVDHAIWVCNDGRAKASENFTAPPESGVWRLIGGFHFAPGSNASGLNTGGDDAPQINEHSFWDVKFRPTCPDPRGMTLVANNVWVDIYLTGAEAIVNGSSKYNVEIADGSSPPKIPLMFGGDGSANYGSYTWFEACELAQSFSKRLPTQQEFMAAAFGTTEASSIGTDQLITKLNDKYTSKWGLIQATGVMYVWGIERGGPFADANWDANTDGRGSEYNAPNAALFGGAWYSGSDSGSRCSYWGGAASSSSHDFGSRFACDHLQLD